MKDDRTRQTCEYCSSHIIHYKDEQGKIKYECVYCGHQPEDLNFDDLSSEDWGDNDYEEENM